MRFLYEHVILRWELDIESQKGFNIKKKEFQAFRRGNGITLEPLANAAEFAARMNTPLPAGNWFVFSNTESAQPRSLFKHIRNAAAHGHIKKIGKKLSFQSYNTKGKETMRGEIQVGLFEQFIHALVDTATTKQEAPKE